ncbi:MAG: helix-turn-helix transcriptional regulator [Xanthobacteraceae bacterium]
MSQNRIAEHRKKRGMTQQQLADALGIHWMTISKLERGKMQLTEGWLEHIGKELKVPIQDLIKPGRATREIVVMGKIKDGVNFILDPEGGDFVEMVDEGPDLVSEWFLVEGSDLEPFYFDGDAIRFTYYWNEDYPYLVGRLAHVTFDVAPDSDHSVFAIVERHLGEAQFDLRSIKGIRFQNVRVTEIGIITGLMIKGPDYPEGKKPDNLPNTA